MPIRRFVLPLRLPLGRLVLVSWVGALWCVGYVVAPVLFASLPRFAAGEVAGKLFAIVAWIGILAAPVLAGLCCCGSSPRLRWWAGLLVAMWLLSLAQLLWLQPAIATIKLQLAAGGGDLVATNRDFSLWHGLSSGLYLLQSLGGVLLVLYWRDGGNTVATGCR